MTFFRETVGTICAIALMASLAGAAFAQGAMPLEISDGHLFFAPKRSRLFVLVDIWPNRNSVEPISVAEREALLITTATKTAKALLTKPDMTAIESVRVEFGYVKNLDEYARQDYSSMVRHGYVVLARNGTDVSVVEKKLDFQSSR